MRKIKLYIAISINGKIANSDGNVDWLENIPNPENAGTLTYQDENKNCYKYESKEVKCPSDPNLILEHPLIIH